MEIKFNPAAVPFLRSLSEQTQTREETQELRLTEGMPDIGRILGCWGQCVVRSKEWRNGGMGISGGVMVWVLYAPEDGSAPQTVESWIPFQQKWDFEDHNRDGIIWIQPVLKSLDARSVSPRKIMVRANVSTFGRALQPGQEEIYQAEGLPEDIQLLRQTYPMELPVEAGEKLVTMDEEFPMEKAEKLVYYTLVPRITEWKILGSRLVFKGVGGLRLLYTTGDQLQSWDAEVPFSQFADLDRDHSPAAGGEIAPIVTDMEVTLEEGRLRLKAAVAAQFVIFDRMPVELISDAYSPARAVEPQYTQLQLPARLDHWKAQVEPSMVIPAEMGTMVDLFSMVDIPQQRGNDLLINGSTQVLYYDPAGTLQSGTGRFEQLMELGRMEDSGLQCAVTAMDEPVAGIGGEGMSVMLPLEVQFQSFGRQGLPMVTGLEMGEASQLDMGRPSLILCRCQGGNLWDLAKEHGSTVDAIRSANGLDGEPEPARMLLVPIP